MVTLKLLTAYTSTFTSPFRVVPIVDWISPCCTFIYRVYKLSLMKCVQHFPNTLPGNGHKTVTSASSTAAHHSTAIWTSIMGRTTEWAALHRRALRQGCGGRGRCNVCSSSHDDEHHSSCRGIYKEQQQWKGWLVPQRRCCTKGRQAAASSVTYF